MSELKACSGAGDIQHEQIFYCGRECPLCRVISRLKALCQGVAEINQEVDRRTTGPLRPIRM